MAELVIVLIVVKTTTRLMASVNTVTKRCFNEIREIRSLQGVHGALGPDTV